jgi:hypothetical protein
VSDAQQDHPFVAVARPTTPDVAEPPVPTLMENDSVPLLCVTLGLVPKPLEIVGALAELMIVPPLP